MKLAVLRRFVLSRFTAIWQPPGMSWEPVGSDRQDQKLHHGDGRRQPEAIRSVTEGSWRWCCVFGGFPPQQMSAGWCPHAPRVCADSTTQHGGTDTHLSPSAGGSTIPYLTTSRCLDSRGRTAASPAGVRSSGRSDPSSSWTAEFTRGRRPVSRLCCLPKLADFAARSSGRHRRTAPRRQSGKRRARYRDTDCSSLKNWWVLVGVAHVCCTVVR